MRRLLLLLVLSSSGCAGISAATRARQESDAAPAAMALQAAKFDDAARLADAALATDASNARAHAIAALARFVVTNHRLVSDVLTLASAVAISSALRGNFIDTELFDAAFEKADRQLVQVDTHLGAAGKDPGVSLELCLACWEVDWNRTGEADERDRALFEVERDAAGQPNPPGDPGRRPTFRFDVTDVHWLRALLSFERAGLELLRAWDWGPLAQVMVRRGSAREVHVPLKSAERARHAHALLLEALEESAACRASALAETDDEREWLPNPRQRQHPIPLEVDEALYATWAEVLEDSRALLRSEQGLDIAALARLNRDDDLPHGFIDFGRWLTLPHELVLVVPSQGQRSSAQALEAFLRGVFGDAFSPSMPASSLPTRLKRMNDEVKSGRESFERKLRYLFWIN